MNLGYITEGADVDIGDLLFTVEIVPDKNPLDSNYPEYYSPNYLKVYAEYKGFIHGIEVNSGDVISSNQVVMKISRNSERLRANRDIKLFFVLGAIIILHAFSSLYFGEMYIGSKVGSGGFTARGDELYLVVFVQACWGVAISLFGVPVKYPQNIDDKLLDALSLEEQIKLHRKLALPRNIASGILFLVGLVTLYTYAFIN